VKVSAKIHAFKTKVKKRLQFLEASRELPGVLPRSNVNLRSNVPFTVSTLTIKYDLEYRSLCHVGAHKGDEVYDYLELNLEKIVLIEPVAESFAVLKERTKGMNTVTAIQIAAGDFDGEVEVNLASNDSQSSSILEPRLHLSEAPQVRFVGKELVRVNELDSILGADFHPEFLVIDVQGFEMHVLRGAAKSLISTRYLFIEVNRGETYVDCAKIWEIDTWLADFGFHRVLTRWWDLWGDSLYVRQN
jgi:FkbM family methyltransferase